VGRDVFVTGGTGYIGRPMIAALLARGHTVRALVRPESAGRLPPGAIPVPGNALNPESFRGAIPPSDTLVHLVGTPRPNPRKVAEFSAVDLRSIVASVAASRDSGIRHLVYLSVAQPAPVMRRYQEVRKAGEQLIRESGIPSTLVRPWYVLGPGHRWPYAMIPLYWLLRRLPATRAGAERLGLVTLSEMVATLVDVVEQPASRVRVVDVPGIRATAAGAAGS
jgi:uncharacterized protein YbjT (DUF2867 family)